MLEAILKLLPAKHLKAALYVLLMAGGIWLGVSGKDHIRAWAAEEAKTQVKIIINDEIREAAKQAAVDAARQAAKEVAKEIGKEQAANQGAIDKKFAEQDARIKKLEKK